MSVHDAAMFIVTRVMIHQCMWVFMHAVPMHPYASNQFCETGPLCNLHMLLLVAETETHVIDINPLSGLGAEFQSMNMHPEHLTTAPQPYQDECTLSQPPQLLFDCLS